MFFGSNFNPEVLEFWWMEAKNMEIKYSTQNQTVHLVGS